MKPTFSVIIPTYNRADLVQRAIRSVLNQTFVDFELIVVDDGSTDDTQEIVNAFDDERILYLRRDGNRGVARARNEGVSQARGKYVSFLDDDDEYLAAFLERVFERIESAPDEVGFILCGLEFVEDTSDGERSVRRVLWDPGTSDLAARRLRFLRDLPFGTGCGLTVRRRCFDSVGYFDEAMRGKVDAEYAVRLGQAFDFDVIGDYLVRVHYHSGPRLTHSPQRADAVAYLTEKHEHFLRGSTLLWTLYHYRAGLSQYHAGNKEKGRSFLLKGLKKNPFYWPIWKAMMFFEILGTASPGLRRKLLRRRSV